MKEYQVPVVVEVILERVTNIAMGTEIDNDQRVRGTRSICRWTTRRRPRRRRRDCSRPNRRTQTMPKFAANLTMLFTELPFLDRFAAARGRRLRRRRVSVPL